MEPYLVRKRFPQPKELYSHFADFKISIITIMKLNKKNFSIKK
jgi:hypothetical protein